jgi:prefoldin subunit 5
MLSIERRLTSGDIVAIVLLLISVGGAYAAVNGRLSVLEEFMRGLVSLEKTMIRLETKLDEKARQDEKIEKKLERIEERMH